VIVEEHVVEAVVLAVEHLEAVVVLHEVAQGEELEEA
jgi:hypothetical protein